MVTKVGGALVQLASIIEVLPLVVLVLGNDLEQILLLFLFEHLGVFIFLLELFDVFESLLGLLLHSVFLFRDLFLVLLLKQLSLLVSTTFQVSHLLQGFIVVNVVFVARVNSYCVELHHFLPFHGVLLSFFYFHLSALFVLNGFVFQEFVLLGFGFILFMLH